MGHYGEKATDQKLLSSAIYGDGAQNKTTGDNAWGSVVDEKGNDLIERYKELFTDLDTREEELPVGKRRIVVVNFTDVAIKQVNGAEIVALMMALRIVTTVSNSVKIVYTDSTVAKKWSTGEIADKTLQKMDPKKIRVITECARLRKIFEKNGGKVVWIDGDNNRADLGYGHKIIAH